jgi:hypothetical protein
MRERRETGKEATPVSHDKASRRGLLTTMAAAAPTTPASNRIPISLPGDVVAPLHAVLVPLAAAAVKALLTPPTQRVVRPRIPTRQCSFPTAGDSATFANNPDCPTSADDGARWNHRNAMSRKFIHTFVFLSRTLSTPPQIRLRPSTVDPHPHV